MKPIPYGRQWIDKGDIEAVNSVLRSDMITQGMKIDEFERALSKYCGAKYAVTVSSGTAALHLACLAAGLEKGDEAITTPITFLATANSVIYAGSKPVFADIDPDTFNINPDEIKKYITKKTKAILPVHFAGLACDMPKIWGIAREKDLIVIEDACHALGAQYKYRGKWIKVGSCRHSDMTVLSFHPVKHITTGEGGAITTNNKKIYEKLLALRAHGIHKTPDMVKKHGLWYYEMQELGFNYRITDFQCALGLSQLKKANDFILKRRKVASLYKKAFKEIDSVELPQDRDDVKHVHHLYVLRIDFKKLKQTRKDFVFKMKKRGINTQVHYIPIYRQPYYKKVFHIKNKEYPCAENYYERALSLPIYPKMTGKDIKYVISTVTNCIEGAE